MPAVPETVKGSERTNGVARLVAHLFNECVVHFDGEPAILNHEHIEQVYGVDGCSPCAEDDYTLRSQEMVYGLIGVPGGLHFHLPLSLLVFRSRAQLTQPNDR